MALTSLIKDFVTRGGASIEGTSLVTTSTFTSGLNTGTFQVAGGASFAKNIIVGSTSTFYGPAIYNNTLTANSPVTINSTLNVTGLTTLGNTTATIFTATSLTVNSDAYINGKLTGNGQTTLGNLNAAITTVTTFYATGQSILQGVSAGLTTATQLIVTGQSTLAGVTATIVTATSLVVSGAATISGALVANSGAAATSPSNGSGALQVTGGAGISGSIYVGGTAYIAGDLYVDGTQFTVNSTTISSGDKALVLSTGSTAPILAINAGLYIGATSSTAYTSFTYDGVNSWIIPSATTSSGGLKIQGIFGTASTTTGALQVAGGVGIGGGVFVGGIITATSINATLGNASNQGNIYGGLPGQLVYQSAASQTGFVTTGSNGSILTLTAGLPVWTSISGLTAGSATTASNLASVTLQNNDIPYQSGAGQTAFSNSLQYFPTGYAGASGLFSTTNILISGGNNATAATGSTGSLMVTGGVGISQDLWVGGNINVAGKVNFTGIGSDTLSSTTGTFVNVAVTGTGVALTVSNSASISGVLTVNTVSITSTLASTSTTASNALVVAGGIAAKNAFISGDTNLTGNLYVTGIISGTNITQLTANSGVFYGDSTGNGALYAGVVGYTPFAQTMAQFSGNLNNYMEINVQNINAGAKASTDIVASADNVTTSSAYIDMGITNSGWDGTQLYSLGTALGPNDGYVMVGQNVSTADHRGDLVFGTTTDLSQIKFIIAATATQVTTASVAIIMNSVGTNAISTLTGTLVVAGGVGVSGNMFVGGNFTSTSAVLTTLNVTGQTTLGSTTATTFTATTALVNGNLTVQGQSILQGVTATIVTATTALVNGNLTVQGQSILQGVTATLVTATSIIVSGQSTLASVTATLFTATSVTVIGNETVSGTLGVTGQTTLGSLTATITTVTSLTVTGAATINGALTLNSPIILGNATATNFTVTGLETVNTMIVSGVSTFTNTVNITTTTNGTLATSGQSLLVSGGVGIAGNLVVAQTITAGSTGTVGSTVPAFFSNNYLDSSYTSASLTSGQAGVTQYLDTFSTSSYRTAEYLVQITDTGFTPPNIHIEKIMLFQDGGTNVYLSEFGVMTNNGELGTFDAAYSGTNVVLKFTPTSPSAMVLKIQRTAIIL